MEDKNSDRIAGVVRTLQIIIPLSRAACWCSCSWPSFCDKAGFQAGNADVLLSPIAPRLRSRRSWPESWSRD